MSAPAVPAEGGHEKVSKSLLTKILIETPEKLAKKGWGAVKWILGNTRDLITGTIGGTLKASAGTALGTLADTGSTIADVVKGIEHDIEATKHEIESGRHLEKIGAAVGGIVETTGNAVANTMKWFGRVGKGAVTRFVSGSADVFDAVTFHAFDKGEKAGKAPKTPAKHNGGGHHGTPAPAH